MNLTFRIKLHLKGHGTDTSNACVYFLTVQNGVIRVEIAQVTAQAPISRCVSFLSLHHHRFTLLDSITTFQALQ